MAESNFKINITADASGAVAGAGQAAAALKQITGQSTQANQEVAASTEKVVEKTQEWGKATEAQAEKVSKLGGVSLRSLGVITAAATVAISVVKRMVDGLDRLGQSLGTAEWEGYASVVKEQARAMEEGRLKAAAFAEQMRQLRSATDTASQAAEKLMVVFKARQTAEEKVDEARRRMEIAQAEGDKDPVRKQERILEIEERYAARQRERADRTARFELDEQHRKLTNEQIAAAGFEKALAREREAQKGMKSEKAINTELAVTERDLAATQQKYNEHLERFNELDAKGWGRRVLGTASPEQTEFKLLGPVLDAEFAQLSRQRALMGLLEAQAPAGIEAWRTSKSRESYLEGLSKSTTERAQGIAGMLPTQEAVAGIESGARSEVGRIESLTRAQSAANAGATVQDRLAEAVAQQVEKTGSAAAGMVSALRSVSQQMEQTKADIRTLENQIANMRNSR